MRRRARACNQGHELPESGPKRLCLAVALCNRHHNYGVDRRGISVDLFNVVTGHGRLSLYFFVIALILVLAVDLDVIPLLSG